MGRSVIFVVVMILSTSCSLFSTKQQTRRDDKKSAEISIEFINREIDEYFDANKVSTVPGLKKAKNIVIKPGSLAGKYRSALLREWSMAQNINFAARYFVPSGIACGVACNVIFVIDWESGLIIDGPSMLTFEVRPGSTILLLNPGRDCESADGPPILYKFQNKQFEKLSFELCT